MGRVLNGFGPKRLDLFHGGLPRHAQLDQDARGNQPGASGTTLAVDRQRGAFGQSRKDDFPMGMPSSIEVSQRDLGDFFDA